jgi:prepilin-type processing-associated H-X9-DG protein
MRNGSAMKHKSSNAFTLTELLVVAPVALLLGTMLFAVSNDAKQQLQAAACLNNMRQWGLGFMLYANDYNDYFPYDGQPGYVCGGLNTNAWFNVVPPYIGQTPLCQLYTAGTPPTPLTKSVWSCPSSAITILFCEEPEDIYPETVGMYDTVTRHFGGSNFVFGDGHADWLSFTNFCRNGNRGCPAPLNQIQWDDSSIGGDWKSSAVHYHWWPFANASTSQN